MNQAIAIFVVINFLIIGLSHLVQPDAWKEFFTWLHSRGRAGAFANGMLALGMGSMIISFHQVWNGLPMILTLIGYVYLAKAVMIFLMPEWGVRSMGSVQSAGRIKFAGAGIVMIGISLILVYCLFQGMYTT